MVVFFCIPLFLGLSRLDLHGDEAIYSYAVDRMLETGDWLTPRLSPTDRPHLSKPPLKYWMVASLIGSGLLPHNEAGLRFVDALLGSIAFIYLYWLGRWLGGALCGVVTVLVLFTLDSLLFVHGLRSNTMEAALFLSYCGGIYHFARWAEGLGQSPKHRQRSHALAVGAYFVLGFMTKFVAALFLPLVCLVAFALRPGAREHARRHWRDGVASALLVLAATLPWWVYETFAFGERLWHVMLGRNVYVRFTSTVNPEHLQPWSFYFSRTWNELFYADSAWIVAAGMILLSIKAWQGRPWLARLFVVWWLLPTVLISIGTSKLYHYAYPFLPPLALGAGYAASAMFRAADGKVGAVINRWHGAAPVGSPAGVLLVARWTLFAGGAVAFALAAWTSIVGQVRWEIGEVTLLRSSSLLRPLSLGGIMWGLGGYAFSSVRFIAVCALALVLPLSAYPETAKRLLTVDHPLRSLEACAMRVRRAGAETGTGVYNAAEGMNRHSYFYYLRHLGPWIVPEHPRRAELRRRLFTAGEQTPVILWRKRYGGLITEVKRTRDRSRAGRGAPGAHRQTRRPAIQLNGVAAERDLVVLMPGPYQACVAPAARAGGQVVHFVANPKSIPRG